MSGPKITVAGAGVLGLACALDLAQAGCDVTVCDPAPPLSGASGVAAGMLAPVFETVLDEAATPHFDLLMAARDLWPDFAMRSGIVLDRAGAMAAGDDAWIAGLHLALRRLGMHVTDLTPSAARTTAPGLSPDVTAALMIHDDWRLAAQPSLLALRAAIEAAGGRFSGEAVRQRRDADWLVVATGAARDLAPELAVLSPIKGHIVRIRTNDRPAMVVRGQGAYVAPTDDGVLLGATMEKGVANVSVDLAKAAPLLAAGARLFPHLGEAPREIVAGVRAATPDGLPLVGESAEPGVLVAAGARRNGWLLAPMVARIVAARVLGRDAGRWDAHLRAGRFSA
jgi:glycine oxidase